MTSVPAASPPGRLRQLAEFARASEPRRPLSGRSAAFDVFVAAVFLLASVYVAVRAYGTGFPAAAATTVPLALRRRYPLAVFLFVVLAALATTRHATDVTFAVIVFAGYSAAVHSRFRGAALLCLVPIGLLIAAVFWVAQPASIETVIRIPGPHGTATIPIRSNPGVPGLAGIDSAAAGGPLRVAGLLVLVSLVSVAIVGAVIYAGDRIRRLQTEHEAATQQAIERERARIASELHDVVTHNVSVMIVQAGAARQVLADSPGKARTALLAVEASGRAAMTELRHLLGLLNPALTSGAAAGGPAAIGQGAAGLGVPGMASAGGASVAADEELRPQPGLDQLRPLIDRVTAAGLPVELHVPDEQRELPPGLDLAAFRVVQEALTNVLKHAGKSPTSVRLEYRGGDLVVDVADVGRRDPAAALTVTPGTGRGLLGLRERAALYGGRLDAGPRPGGGWRVRAHFPVDMVPVRHRVPSAVPSAVRSAVPRVVPSAVAPADQAAAPAGLAPATAEPQ